MTSESPTPAEEFPPGMIRDRLGFRTRRPHRGERSGEEREKVPREHGADNRRLPERIRGRVAADPAIAGGRVPLDLRPWPAPHGLRTDDRP